MYCIFIKWSEQLITHIESYQCLEAWCQSRKCQIIKCAIIFLIVCKIYQWYNSSIIIYRCVLPILLNHFLVQSTMLQSDLSNIMNHTGGVISVPNTKTHTVQYLESTVLKHNKRFIFVLSQYTVICHVVWKWQ